MDDVLTLQYSNNNMHNMHKTLHIIADIYIAVHSTILGTNIVVLLIFIEVSVVFQRNPQKNWGLVHKTSSFQQQLSTIRKVTIKPWHSPLQKLASSLDILVGRSSALVAPP